MEKKLGSHNSWSFAKPIKWWMPHFVAKCQEVNIKQQFKLGVRYFDLRLKWYNNHFEVAHGPVIFKVDWEKDLQWLSSIKDSEDIYVRVLLEYNKEPDDAELLVQRFCIQCSILQSTYPDIKFIEGRAKWNWEILFSFNHFSPPIIDRYSSTTSLFNSDSRFLRICDDLYPYLYAKLKNKENYKEFCKNNNGEYLLIDFVNIV